MKDVAHVNAIAVSDASDVSHDFGELRARHHGILDEEMRCDAPHGAERFLPTLPQAVAFGVVACDADRTRAMRPANGVDARLGVQHLDGEAVDLDEHPSPPRNRPSGWTRH